MKYFMISILFLIVSITCAQNYMPIIEIRDCPYFMQDTANKNGNRISCVDLLVPEDRNNIADSLELRLFVVKIDSDEPADNAPLIHLEGGPGGAATARFDDWLKSELQKTQDIILIDQRGTGLSLPSLNCPEMDGDDLNAIEDCYHRLLQSGINLNAYNSVSNANDIHDLLVAMDIPKANIYGSSYGARLGLTMVREFPERIQTLTIDAVYPPQVNSLIEEASNGNQAFEQLFKDCTIDLDCNRVYPDLRQSFYTAIESMNHDIATIYDQELGATIKMTGDDFVRLVFSQLYDMDNLPYLPAMIAAYANREFDYDPLIEDQERAFFETLKSGELVPDDYDLIALEYLDIKDIYELYDYYESLSDQDFNALYSELEDYAYFNPIQNHLDYASIIEAQDYYFGLNQAERLQLEAEVFGIYDDNSEGMHYSVECAEEISFINVDSIFSRAENMPPILHVLAEVAAESLRECDIWDVTKSAAIENQPVVSNIPTLIFSGLYDPITPYQWGDDAQSYLKNSFHFIFPNVGHGAINAEPCAEEIMVSFLDNPQQLPNSTCITELSSPDFYIRP